MYLRRNQEDVLAELPDLIRTDEWVEFGRYDYAAYRDAVVQGNFMAMRRAAYAAYAAYGEGMAAQCANWVGYWNSSQRQPPTGARLSFSPFSVRSWTPYGWLWVGKRMGR